MNAKLITRNLNNRRTWVSFNIRNLDTFTRMHLTSCYLPLEN